MDEKEVWERITAAESGLKSIYKRMDSIERLTRSVSDMVVELRHMREDLNRLRGELEDVKSRPGKRYERIATAIITAITSGLVGFVISQVIY